MAESMSKEGNLTLFEMGYFDFNVILLRKVSWWWEGGDTAINASSSRSRSLIDLR